MSFEDEVEKVTEYCHTDGTVFTQDEIKVKTKYNFNGESFTCEYMAELAYEKAKENEWISQNMDNLEKAWESFNGGSFYSPLCVKAFYGNGYKSVGPDFHDYCKAQFMARKHIYEFSS